MMWNPRMETMPQDQIKKMQYVQLKKLVNNLYSFNRFYHDKMREANVSPLDINSLRDIAKLPFMVKQDLRDNYPDKMLTVDRSEIVRFHMSSGTSGKPTCVAYTRNDLGYWTEALARSLTAAGLTSDDTLQISYGYGLFTGGLGLHYGAESLGISVLPASTGDTRKQLELMQDLQCTAIACTPSYLTHLITTARTMGIDWKRDMSLRRCILGAEPWSEAMRNKMEAETGAKCIDIYGTSEQAGPMFCECESQKGPHICPDVMYVEILDTETGEPLEPGNKGELVCTMLRKEAMPIIRYKMKDITSLHEETCECGRTSPRISRITGRADDMLIIRGINVYPSQIEYTLMRIPQVGDQYMILVTREGDLDRMKIQVEIRQESFSDKIVDMHNLRTHIELELKKYLNIAVEVELKAPGELPRFDGKSKRIIDNRVY